MFSLVSRKFLAVRNIALYSVSETRFLKEPRSGQAKKDAGRYHYSLSISIPASWCYDWNLIVSDVIKNHYVNSTSLPVAQASLGTVCIRVVEAMGFPGPVRKFDNQAKPLSYAHLGCVTFDDM